ncbi:chalcone isomerase family protein [bacterium]|nr:chalcone isomerase family protein [bacterium]
MRHLFFVMLIAMSSLTSADTALKKVGEAQLKVLFWKVYNSRLFSADGSYLDGQRPIKLEIEYLRDIEADQLVQRTAAEWQSQGVAHPHQDKWLQSLSALWPDVSKNDVIALQLDRDDRSSFFINGTFLGYVEDPAFGQSFIDIWLSPKTSRPELRRMLIGQR